jgi:hypothetical protein
MMNLKETSARTEVRPPNMIGAAMEDLHEAKWKLHEKELKEEMTEARRRKLVCFQKTRDQENCLDHHDYGNRYIYGDS